MSQDTNIEANAEETPQVSAENISLTDELRERIRTSSVKENFELAVETREKYRQHMAKAKYENGVYDFSDVEGMTEDEGYEIAQNYQQVFAAINEMNQRKLLSDQFSFDIKQDAVGAPAMQMFDSVANGNPRDVFDRFEQVHGMDSSQILKPGKFVANRATVDDFLLTDNTNVPRPGLPATPAQVAAGYVVPTWTGGSTEKAPGYSATGVPVDRYLSQIPAQMHLRRRDYLTPLIPRIPCPPVTDTLRYIAEEMASGAPGSSNKVAGTREGQRATAQDMSTREIAVTVIKRMISATITDEQASDTVQARQIMNDNLMIKIQEDFEDQIINGNAAIDTNMTGLMHRNTVAPSDVGQTDASNTYYKQTMARGVDEDRTELDFFLHALTQYLKPRPDHNQNVDGADLAYGSGRSPTHIVLPLSEKMRLMGVKDNQGRYLWANTVEGDFISLWGLPIITSDFIEAEKGLILALDEIAVVVKAGVEWRFGLKDDDLTRGQSTIVAQHRANVLVKRPRSIMILSNLAGK